MCVDWLKDYRGWILKMVYIARRSYLSARHIDDKMIISRLLSVDCDRFPFSFGVALHLLSSRLYIDLILVVVPIPLPKMGGGGKKYN